MYQRGGSGSEVAGGEDSYHLKNNLGTIKRERENQLLFRNKKNVGTRWQAYHLVPISIGLFTSQ